MLFAAGLGTRMKDLTSNKPKSLLEIHGKPILHYALDLCKLYPFKKIIINTHYFSSQIESSLNSYAKENTSFPKILSVYEPVLLETGGAIKNAINMLGAGPIFTLNTDIIFQANYNFFAEMSKKWDHKKMDFLILMQPTNNAIGYTGCGDFEMDLNGNLTRPDSLQKYSYMFAGISLLDPHKIAQNPLNIFSLKEYYLNFDRVVGIEAKNAKWCHLTSSEDLVVAELSL